uniref:Uncharacterized protein n=1 Tax=Peronospora matthiolae TaxID=2874970 RepID=A0AAV1TUF7_9STRA
MQATGASGAQLPSRRHGHACLSPSVDYAASPLAIVTVTTFDDIDIPQTISYHRCSNGPNDQYALQMLLPDGLYLWSRF